jgi:protein-L-isoaspartate(D-aspartate) O-methyltransferase
VSRLQEEGISNQQVLDVIRNTPRHIFVDEALASRSYEDTALPIGYGQTISQPYVVARMTTALLESGPLNRVLEIGTGSGYQAAVMAPLAGEIFSVERIRPLLDQARSRLTELQLRNVRLKYSDGSWGWPEFAPFDAIIATAACLAGTISHGWTFGHAGRLT